MSSRLRNSVEIVGRGWTINLPTGTGYDREVLFDHLREAVQRHGKARLSWSTGSASIDRVAKRSATRCTCCGGTARKVVGTSGAELLCLSCIWDRARRKVRPITTLVARGQA